MNGIYRKSIKQRIERFFEKVHECIHIFTTGWDKYTFLYLRNLRETKKKTELIPKIARIEP